MRFVDESLIQEGMDAAIRFGMSSMAGDGRVDEEGSDDDGFDDVFR